MIKVTLVREITGKPANIKFSKDTWNKIGQVVVQNTRQNIQQQKTTEGSPLKKNKPVTLRRKRRLGQGNRSLVDSKKRFANTSNYIIKRIKDGIKVSLQYREIAVYVQKRGYVKWFGLSKTGFNAVRALFRKDINRARKKAQSYKKRKVIK